MTIGFVLALAVLGTSKRIDHAPAWLDFTIAGYALANDEKRNQLGAFDPSKGFFILRYSECDGADVGLILTRDRKELANEGYRLPEKESSELNPSKELAIRRFRSLSTGKGVTIGDAPSVVIRTLGKPTKIKRGHYLSFDYSCRFDGKQITEEYTFKHGKLIEIAFGWSMDEVR
jgi:hypothetical protein